MRACDPDGKILHRDEEPAKQGIQEKWRTGCGENSQAGAPGTTERADTATGDAAAWRSESDGQGARAAGGRGGNGSASS